MKQKEILDSVQKYFQEIDLIHTVIVYGSVAEGHIHASSDVDIAIAGVRELDLEYLLEINKDLQILLHREIDMIDLDKAEGLIHYKVMTKGIRLKNTAGKVAEHLIRAVGYGTDFLPQLMEMQYKRVKRSAYGI